jgi:hypothetical protein
MAKTNKPEKKGGPYLAAACFCNNVIEDKLGTISGIQIIDQIIVQLPPNAPPDFPSEENRLMVPIWALIVFRTGYSPGRHTVKLVCVSPSGKKEPGQGDGQTVNFTPQEYGGAQFANRITFAVYKGGLFWIDVMLDGKRVTRMPIRIEIRRAESSQSPEASEAERSQN